jgi:hypothetical protein
LAVSQLNLSHSPYKLSFPPDNYLIPSSITKFPEWSPRIHRENESIPIFGELKLVKEKNK